MSGDLIKARQGELIGFIHNSHGELNPPRPFEREIFLFDTYIAGTSYIEDMNNGNIVLEKGQRLNFYREPNNKFDPNAIVIKNLERKKVGYVPRQNNIVFSRLMDAGKELFGKISSIENRGEMQKIRVRIFLKD